MLILEGADQLGKTTLANKLLKELHKRGYPYVYRHFTRLPDCWKYPMSYLAHVSEPVVQDRFHMSEIVYTYMRNEPQKLTDIDYKDVDSWVKESCGFTVLLTATDRFLHQQWKASNRKEMYTFQQNVVANRLFKFIADGKMSGYDPHFDATFHLDDFIDDGFVEPIIDDYEKTIRKVKKIC